MNEIVVATQNQLSQTINRDGEVIFLWNDVRGYHWFNYAWTLQCYSKKWAIVSQSNRETNEGKADHPDRDKQFQNIHQKALDLVVSLYRILTDYVAHVILEDIAFICMAIPHFVF